MNGVQEEAAEFHADADLAGAGRFRSVAGVGPVYEIVSVAGDRVRIRFVDADEEFDYPRRDAESDPLA